MSAKKPRNRFLRAYLRLWREADDGTSWPIINANLKFATFNVCVAIVLVLVAIAIRVAA